MVAVCPYRVGNLARVWEDAADCRRPRDVSGCRVERQPSCEALPLGSRKSEYGVTPPLGHESRRVRDTKRSRRVRTGQRRGRTEDWNPIAPGPTGLR